MFSLFPGYISINKAQPLPLLLIGVICITFFLFSETMDPAMFRLRCQNHQIVRIVIPVIAVYVMNGLAWTERAAYHYLSDDPVRMPPEKFTVGLSLAAVPLLCTTLDS